MIVSGTRPAIITAAAVSLSTRSKFWRRDVYRMIFSIYCAMPDATAERGDVNFLRVGWISHNAMTPFKVEPRYAAPVFATVD
jgi:hypothetical protein